MKNFLLFFLSLFLFFQLNIAYANIEKGKWNFVKDADYCYIGSSPEKIDIPKGKKRGDTYIIVYKINRNPEAVVQIDAGYSYNNEEPVIVKIDKNIYDFFSQEDSAWTNNDKKVIQAMKKGLKLTVTGISSRGTKTIDTYTLNGFTSAYNKLTNDC